MNNSFLLFSERLRAGYNVLHSTAVPWVILVCSNSYPAIIQHVNDAFDPHNTSEETVVELKQKEMASLGESMAEKMNDSYGVIYTSFITDETKLTVTYMQYTIDEDLKIYVESFQKVNGKLERLPESEGEKYVNNQGWIEKNGQQPVFVAKILNKLIRSYRLYSMMNI